MDINLILNFFLIALRYIVIILLVSEGLLTKYIETVLFVALRYVLIF